jgi:hypothetical protein
MRVPLDYNQRIALKKQLPSTVPVPASHNSPQAHGTAWNEIQRQADALCRLGQASDMADALQQVAHANPTLYEAYVVQQRNGVTPETVTKSTHDSPLAVTHPRGVKKDGDGVPLSWEEQIKHWQEYPGTYERYRMHFATSTRVS